MGAPLSAASVFGAIYRDRAWDPKIPSGVGSAPKHTATYREVLRGLLGDLDVRSVVDIGCGDWNLSGCVDWRGVEYLGLDVVPQLVDELRERHGSPTVRFEVADLTRDELPPADLAIVKDVLQHWPNAAVRTFLDRLPAVRFALLTNDVLHDRRSALPPWRRGVIGVVNSEIDLGDWRPLRLTEPPFDLDADPIVEFEVRHSLRRWRKEVLLWRR